MGFHYILNPPRISDPSHTALILCIPLKKCLVQSTLRDMLLCYMWIVTGYTYYNLFISFLILYLVYLLPLSKIEQVLLQRLELDSYIILSINMLLLYFVRSSKS